METASLSSWYEPGTVCPVCLTRRVCEERLLLYPRVEFLSRNGNASFYKLGDTKIPMRFCRVEKNKIFLHKIQQDLYSEPASSAAAK